MNTDPEIAVGAKSLQEGLHLLLNGDKPLAIWRLPFTQHFQLALSHQAEPVHQRFEDKDQNPGFIFAPFDTEQIPLFIEASEFYEFNDFQESFQSPSFPSKARLVQNNTLTANVIPADKAKFEETVKKAIENIKEGHFEKVVLSRSILIEGSINPVEHFKKICQKYPSLFCSMVYLPWNEELWIGASPEILMQVDEHGIFQTMSLAGTQSAFDKEQIEIKPKDALWRQKEIEEQALVSRYIINCFKKIRVREYQEIGPRTIQAGNLMHLCSTFEVDTMAINFPEMPQVMLELLHPTSAVCGMPKEPSLKFIQQNEQYDRSFYAGYLGPVNIKKSTKLYVNLRSLNYDFKQIRLFAGCGITAGSDPEKEFLETEMKLKTILLT